MIAEAENELNGPDNAYAYLNKVRERAGADKVEEGSLDKNSFRQMVKDERGRELCFEYTRRFDLIRWGEYVENMNALYNSARAGGEWNQGPTVSGIKDQQTYILISIFRIRIIIIRYLMQRLP